MKMKIEVQELVQTWDPTLAGRLIVIRLGEPTENAWTTVYLDRKTANGLLEALKFYLEGEAKTAPHLVSVA